MSAMARSHVATFCGVPPSAAVARRVPRLAAAVLPPLVAAAIAALAGQVHAAPIMAVQPGAGPIALTVTSVSPMYAQTGQPITIKGMVRNLTGSAMNALSVGMLSASTPLNSMTTVDEFAAGTYLPSDVRAMTGVTPFLVTTLAPHTVKPWTVRVPAQALSLPCFGVYPMTAQVSDASGYTLARYAVPLPFWPRSPRGCATGSRPRAADISWIWPLIDSPHQGPCQGVLLDNALAASIRPGGRLYDLLTAAAGHHGAGLTFAIDPALLDSLALMRQPYQVGRAASCGHTTQYPADSAASTWLKNLVHATAKQLVFVTPYADVDTAALITQGIATESDLDQAFHDGEQIAHQVLSRDPKAVPLPAAGSKLAAVAWPAGGVASGAVLEYLDTQLMIKTVILAQPAASLPYPPAMIKVTTESGVRVNELLANDSLSRLLRSRAVGSRQLAAISRVSQLFLAQTAMSVAAGSSPIIVTPPRRWNPSSLLANELLADAKAPWLKPVNIGQLSKMARQVTGAVSQSRPRSKLSGRLLAKVKALDSRVGLLESIFTIPDPTLRRAVFGIESSWWRSRGGTRRALAALTRTSQYVSDQFSRLSLGGNRYVTLGGKSGSVIVSVRNGLTYPINVELRVKVTDINGNVSVPIPQKLIIVPPGQVAEKKLQVHASQTGKAVLHFSLVSPAGITLPHGRLTMQVQASNFGRIALIICGAALAVFVFASAARAIRHGRPAPASAPASAGEAVDTHDAPDVSAEPDNVVSDQPRLAAAGQGAADPRSGSPGHGQAEESR
jgi:hypothetical protein